MFGVQKLLLGRNDQVLTFMLKIKSYWNSKKLEQTRISSRFEFVALHFAKNGLRMLPKMGFVRLHKHAKKW